MFSNPLFTVTSALTLVALLATIVIQVLEMKDLMMF